MSVLDKSHAVVSAIHSLLVQALVESDVRLNPSKAFRLKPSGAVALFPGEAEELPDSPLNSAVLQHSLPLFVGAEPSISQTSSQILRGLSSAIEAAVRSDRTLDGLVDWLWVSPEYAGPTPVEALGVEAADWVPITLMAEYSVGR